MDPRKNPYAPGAGTSPPELAGRGNVMEEAAVALDRIGAGRDAKSVLFVGLRGVGKTVLLNRVAEDAEARGTVCVQAEATEDRSLPSVLAPLLRRALIELDRFEAAKKHIRRGRRALASFVSKARIVYKDIELRIDAEPEAGLADSGDLQSDLADLLRVIGEAAREKKTTVALFIDELQCVSDDHLAALVGALHVCRQRRLPVTLVGAGLPQLVGNTGRAKSYAERLFEYPRIGELGRDEALHALRAPAEREGVRFEDAALERIFRKTRGYPYFLQEWGAHSWRVADSSPITGDDVRCATEAALATLDGGFFRVRYDRCTPREREYLLAMARIGPGPHRSGDIARSMKARVTSVAPIRNNLISKGMIYSPAHGDTAFTVPMFDRFLKRAADGA